MKSSISFFQLSLEEKQKELKKLSKKETNCLTEEDVLLQYYNIVDVIDSLTRLREYQLRDIFGRYKIF